MNARSPQQTDAGKRMPFLRVGELCAGWIALKADDGTYRTVALVSASVGSLAQGEANAAFIVEACNAYDTLRAQNAELVKACEAAVAYDDAIRSCANNPSRMATFCSAQGEDLDTLYYRWMESARAALAKVQKEAQPC